MLGKYRTEVVWRVIVGTIWVVVATLALAFIWLPIALLVSIIDAIWQLLFNSEGPVPDMTLQEPFGWWVGNFEWWLFGADSFDPLPYT